MDRMNLNGMEPSSLDIPSLDAWAADYLAQEQEPIQSNRRSFKEGTGFGAHNTPTASVQQTQKAVYGVNLTSEERVALVQQIPPDLVHDMLAILEREALYEQLPPEQRLSARQRPYPPQIPAAVVHAFTQQEEQQSRPFKPRQDPTHRQHCNPNSMRPTKTHIVHQAQPKQPHRAELNFTMASLWVGGLSVLATMEEILMAFSIFGEVVDVSLPKCREKFHNCKWAFVNFAIPESSEVALKLCQLAAADMSLYKLMPGIRCVMADPSLPLEVCRDTGLHATTRSAAM